MNFENSSDCHCCSRRSILATTVAIGFSALSGCNDESETKNREQEPGGDPSKEIRRAKSDLESVYQEINDLPIEENGKFAFNVRGFENDFDHRSLLEKAESVQVRIEEWNADSSSIEDKSSLMAIARLSELLVRERVLTHQFIASGLAFERELAVGEHGNAIKAIRHGTEFLEILAINGQKIEKESQNDISRSVSVYGFDPEEIRDAQDVLRSVAQ